MKKTCHFLAFAATLGLASQAFAWAPSHYRCSFDQITSADKSYGRQRWARTQSQMNVYQYTRNGVLQAKDTRFWDPMYQPEASAAFADYGIYLYPVYTDPSTYEPWIGPGAYGTPIQYPAGTSTEFMTGDQLATLPYSVKPAPIFNDGVCEPGCYTPDQRVLFETGSAPIHAAQRSGREDVITLSAEATFDNIGFTTNTVERYTVDKEAATQEILTFRMRSGGSLSVTLHHPLVNSEGAMAKAMDFVVGEQLVKQDGSLDEIVSIEQKEWYGKVYNLRPVSKDLTSNILVAEGYLNGSGRFQSEFVEELNRIILRNNVPDELVLEN